MSLPEGPLGERFAHIFAGGLYASINVAMVSTGVQLFMTIYGISIFLDAPKSIRKGRLPYIILNLIILFLSTLATVLDAYTDFTAMFFAFGPREYYAAAFELEGQWPRLLSVTCLEVYILLGDGLLLYRCYIIWKDFIWSLILPALLYLSIIGVTITRFVLRGLLSSTSSFTEKQLTQDRLTSTLFVMLTVSLNVVLTSLIVFRLLRAHRQLASVLPNRSQVKVYKGIASILIESVFPLAFFGLGYAILDIVLLWQLWFSDTVKISCAGYPHFFASSKDLNPDKWFGIDCHLDSKEEVVECDSSPCPYRLSLRPTFHQLRRLQTASFYAAVCTSDNAVKAREFAESKKEESKKKSPPVTPPPTVTQLLPEDSPQSFHSADSTPAPVTATTSTAPKSFRPPSTSSEEDSEEEDDNDKEDESEEEDSETPVPFHVTYAALAEALPAESEDTSVAQRSDNEPPTSTLSPSLLSPPTSLPLVQQDPVTKPAKPIPDLSMSDTTLLKLLAEQQETTRRIQQSLDKLTAAKTASTRSPVKAPEPFKGDSGDTQRFLRYFTNWASAESELKGDDKKWISAALSYLQGAAASWAVQYLDQIAAHEAAADAAQKAAHPWPFSGDWSTFVAAFKKRFQPADQEKAAEAQLEALTQGKQSASQFAAKFMEIFPRTGLSQKDGMARFRRKLSSNDRLMLDLIAITKPDDAKPKTLQDYCDIVNQNDFTFHGSSASFLTPTASSRSAPARDPYAMDIDATRVGPSGRSREDFLQAMRGRCFGCGSSAHIKKDGNHGSLRCNHCQRLGHSANVCQDKFMGYPPGRGLTQRRRVAATQEAPFSLFDDSSTPAATIAATSPAPPAATSSNVSLADLLVAQKNQQDILERLEKIQQQGF
ncbi:hypothetical protein CC2G_003512 [Coprinopsis cinerea AmutBmut pab1-1]|nr:hypothetical protein CC2G_003512 [Coprinopsis cinerea AmutBmut pab1-1]